MTRFHWKLTRRDGLLLECELKFRLRDLLVSEKLGILNLVPFPVSESSSCFPGLK
jgi:hypothetical protein